MIDVERDNLEREWFIKGRKYAEEGSQLPELEELLDTVDDMCDWLNYEFSLETITVELKRLNRAHTKLAVAKTRLYNELKASKL